MENKPIEGVMRTAMENIRDMVDVSTVIGEPVVTPQGGTVIPVSRVSFGFASGGADRMPQEETPFAGGAGAGVSVQPVGFLVMEKEQVRLLPAQYATPLDRLIEMLPDLLDECKRYIKERNVAAPEGMAAKK